MFLRFFLTTKNRFGGAEAVNGWVDTRTLIYILGFLVAITMKTNRTRKNAPDKTSIASESSKSAPIAEKVAKPSAMQNHLNIQGGIVRPWFVPALWFSIIFPLTIFGKVALESE